MDRARLGELNYVEAFGFQLSSVRIPRSLGGLADRTIQFVRFDGESLEEDAILNAVESVSDRSSAKSFESDEENMSVRQAAPSAKFRESSSARAKAGSISERRVATPRPDLVVVKIGDRHQKATVSVKERAPEVVARVVRVMNKPGTDRTRVFRSGAGKTVYAYSIDSKDTTKVVREDAAGQRTFGRLVSGRFRALPSAKTNG